MNTDQRDRRGSDAEAIWAAMTSQHLSAAELHRRTGVAQNTITRVLQGRGSKGSVLKLREALGLQPRTIAMVDTDTEDYPPNIVAVQLIVGAVMYQIPETEWKSVTDEIVRILLLRRDATGQ
jgi:transcriptional regulator with XRE-family HTH domain